MISVTFTAKYFGVSIEKDAWVLASALITNIVSGVWGPLNEIFRAKFVHIRELEGEKKALSMTHSLISFIVCVTVVLTILLALLGDQVGNVMASNFTDEGSHLFVLLFLCLLPTMLLNELSSIGTSVLNAYEIYYIPEFVSLISGIFGLVVIILFADQIGIFAFVISNYFGAILLLLMIAYYLRKVEVRLWKVSLRFQWSDVKVFLLFALPFFFPYFIGQLNSLGEKYLSGLIGEGNISSLDYSRQFVTIIQNVLSSVLTTIMVPMLAKYAINNNASSFLQTLKDNIKISYFLVGLSIIFLVGATQPLCEFFFFRGKVSPESLSLIISLTKLFGLALLGLVVYLIFGMTLLAANQGALYAKIGVVNQIVVLALNILLLQYFGIYIFPISFGIVHAVSGAFMLSKLKMGNHAQLLVQVVRSMICALIFSAVFYYLNMALQIDSALYKLIINALIVVLVAPLLAECLGIHTMTYLKKVCPKYGKK
jgi:peptidoglycan biosynthesis protein MviN/MurJ (putative lipid II flippase)